MSDDSEITRLAVAARTGDKSAAEAFIEVTHQQIYRFLTYLVGFSDAEDLTQETYLRAMKSLPRYAERASARTWLLSIARRVAADHIRRSVRSPACVPEPRWGEIAEHGVREQSFRFENEVVLQHLLQALTPERREAFVATQVVGLTYEEAAELYDCPIGTIRSRVARARADLVAALQGHDTGQSRIHGAG